MEIKQLVVQLVEENLKFKVECEHLRTDNEILQSKIKELETQLQYAEYYLDEAREQVAELTKNEEESTLSYDDEENDTECECDYCQGLCDEEGNYYPTDEDNETYCFDEEEIPYSYIFQSKKTDKPKEFKFEINNSFF